MPDYDGLVQYLNQLCLEKATGTLFITTDKKHSVRFALQDGYITSCNYRLKRNHDAIELIKAVKSGKYKFFTGTSESQDKDIARHYDLYTALFGKTSPSSKEVKSESTAPDMLDIKTIDKAVEMIAKELAHFIGPVARLICDEYINNTGQARSKDDLITMTESVATEIGNSVQEKKFTEAVLGGIHSAL